VRWGGWDVRKIWGGSLNDEGVSCPFGTIKLPIDIWYCKKTEKACPIQAWLHPPEFKRLNEYCEADEKTKDGIRSAVLSGKYNGFHHLPGRRLCATHTGAINRRYFYEHDLFWLRDFLNIDNREMRIKIIKADINPNIYYCRICGKCLIEILKKLNVDDSIVESAKSKMRLKII